MTTHTLTKPRYTMKHPPKLKHTIEVISSLSTMNSNKQATINNAHTFLRILEILTNNPSQEYTMSELSRLLDVSKPTTNLVINAYASAGMLEVRDSAQVRAAKVVKTTQAALDFINTL